MSEDIAMALGLLAVFGQGFVLGRFTAPKPRLGRTSSTPASVPRPVSRRSWASDVGPDGTVAIRLYMSIESYPQSTSVMVGVVVPPSKMAKDIRRRLDQQQSDLVESCLSQGMRVPEMAAAAPGKPRKSEVAP